MDPEDEPQDKAADGSSLTIAGMTDEIAELEAAATGALKRAADLDELDEAERMMFRSKKSRFAEQYRRLGSMRPSERRDLGRLLNEVHDRFETLAAARRADLAAAARAERLAADRLDLTEVLPGRLAGHLHPVTQVREELEDIFLGMGYEIAEGPEVETDWHNFEALNIPEDHPARSSVDTFYVEFGVPGSVLLRPHTSPVQIRVLERGSLPVYAVAPGRCYRRDTPDSTHLPVFHQIEALVVDRGVSFGDLKGTIDSFVHALFGSGVRTRLRPAYFPFTEPSAEFEMSCAICGGDGCRTCGGAGWIELGGSGMVHPAVLEATGVDPEEWTGFAFGFGIDRLAMMRHELSDLRVMIENDLRFLGQF
jgi:phenylalanyl-tRNA synthetase alpha chain